MAKIKAFTDKEYNAALERARELSKTVTGANYEYIFPELKETESERIRKELIEFLKLPHSQFVGNRKYEKWIAWLEKQAEQHPPIDIDEAELPFRRLCMVDGFTHTEPKFKIGDWITTTDEEGNVTTEKIIEFWGDKVRLIDTNGFYTLWPKHELKYYHLWTINDAKDGDVLVTEDYIFIFKYILHGGVHLYCHYNFDDEEFDSDIPDAVIGNIHDKGIHFRPATKEQRELLFEKMKEANYEWNADKKELKKTKVASKENEDNRIRKGIIRNLQFLMDRSEGFVKEDLAERIAWLENQCDQTSLQPNERAWLYLVSDVLTWKDGIGQYLDDPRVQELAKKLCSEYAQKLYNSPVLSNSSNIRKNEHLRDILNNAISQARDYKKILEEALEKL